MSEPIQFCVPPELHAQRADKVLSAQVPDMSRTRLQQAFVRGEVWVEGEPIEKKHKLLAGDWVEVILPEVAPIEVGPVSMPLEVLYEDEDVIAVNKACGTVTHPGTNTGNDTLVHGLLHHTGGKLSAQAGAVRPGVVHRLDKETTGVILFAKTDAAYHPLVKMFAERELNKQYLALVQGVPCLARGSITFKIRRHPTHRTIMQVGDEGRDAHTDWSLEQAYARCSLLRCQLHTGRTHQIRVHLSAIGFPILGDVPYGYRYRETEPPQARQRVYLHAQRIILRHPLRPQETLDIQAPLPEDFSGLIEQLQRSE